MKRSDSISKSEARLMRMFDEIGVGIAGSTPEEAREAAVGHVRAVQELLGHSDVSTTMIYTHVLKVAAG